MQRDNSGDEKVTRILNACRAPPDTKLLATLATSPAGLVDDEVRRLACMYAAGYWRKQLMNSAGPLLLGYDADSVVDTGLSDWRDLPRHKDEDQVELDVNRSFIYYPKSMFSLPIPL